MHRQGERTIWGLVAFAAALLLVSDPAPLLAQELRRSPAPQAQTARAGQTPTLLRLEWRGERVEPGQRRDGTGGEAGRKVPEGYSSIVGAMKYVTDKMGESDGQAGQAGSAEEDERKQASATAVIRLTPDYRRLSRPGGGVLVRLSVRAAVVSYSENGTDAEQSAQLSAELARTLARLEGELPRLLSEDETGALIADGQVRLPLRTARGDSPFSHQQMFSRPQGVLRLRRWPVPKLRFVTRQAEGVFRTIPLITPFQPFQVEAVYEEPPDPAPDRVYLTTPGGDFEVSLSPTADNPLIWRSAEILPLPPPPDIREDEEAAEPVAGGPDDGLEGTGPLLPGRPEGGGKSEEGGEGKPPRRPAETAAQPSGGATPPAPAGLPPVDLSKLSPPSIYDDILPMSLPQDIKLSADDVPPLSPLPERPGGTVEEAAAPAPPAAPAGSSLRRRGAGSTPPAAPPGSGAGPGFGFGIDPNVRIAPGQVRRGPVLRRPAPVPPPRSPLLNLIDRFGPDDPQVAALLADGITPEDEAAAARILAERAEDSPEEAQ